MRLLIGTSVLWFGLSMFADGATTLILPDLLEDQLPEGFEVTVLGLVTFVGLAAAALVQPVAGHLSDRLGAGWRRQPVIAAGAGQQDLPAFGPDGCLYVVDWGEIDLAPERGGIGMKQGTGSLWRIRRVALETGELPPKPATWPVNALPLLAAPLAIVVAALVVGALFRGRRRGSRQAGALE